MDHTLLNLMYWAVLLLAGLVNPSCTRNIAPRDAAPVATEFLLYCSAGREGRDAVYYVSASGTISNGTHRAQLSRDEARTVVDRANALFGRPSIRDRAYNTPDAFPVLTLAVMRDMNVLSTCQWDQFTVEQSESLRDDDDMIAARQLAIELGAIIGKKCVAVGAAPPASAEWTNRLDEAITSATSAKRK